MRNWKKDLQGVKSPAIRQNKQPILYAHEQNKQNMLLGYALVLLGFGFAFYEIIFQHTNDPSWLIDVVFGLLIVLGSEVYKRLSYVEVTEQGVKVSNFLFRCTIPFQDIRTARAQLLELAYKDKRGRLAGRVARPYLKRKALFLRLKDDGDGTIDKTAKKLGRRLYYDGMIVVPVPNAEEMANAISRRLGGIQPSGQFKKKKIKSK